METKFNVGDKVRIRKDLEVDCKYDNSCCFNSKMEKYKGKIAVIKSHCMPAYFSSNVEIKNANNCRYRLDIDKGDWSWSSSMLEKIEDKKHFKSLPRDFTGTIDVEKGFITKIVKKKEILDEVEKEYLSAVIKPFKKRIEEIVVNEYSINGAFLSVVLRYGNSLKFPIFKIGTMYKNMEINRAYTLEELGLD